jgi:hypothetical protein
MIKLLALIRNDGRGKVLNIAAGQLNHIAAPERSEGSTVIGNYAAKHHAERTVRLARRGWRRPSDRRT